MAEIYPGLETLEKTHDESRQGEALSISIEKKSNSNGKFLYVESYGCAMNFSDSEIIASILVEEGFSVTKNFNEADLLLINTCSIRDKAEEKIRMRISELKAVKIKKPEALIGIMGCMAERLKAQLLEEEKVVDLVVGPDAYRELPALVRSAEEGSKAINVLLSREETYADINPVRLNSNGITAFISIMRGCDNMCSFCVVPFTRGRERSRDAHSIVREAQELFNAGYREVTLLGQNVDSYKWSNEETNESVSFAQLLERVALVNPLLRVRFSTSHPKDITDEVLHTIKKYHNICKYIHLPVQSGSSRVLELMNRTYNREWYMERVDAIRRIIPECSISADIISGFCTETEEDHQQTLSMMDYVRYVMAYMFAYSERPGTLAARQLKDDVAPEIKSRRLQEIVDFQHVHQAEENKSEPGNVYEVLVEGTSKRSKEQLFGRSSQNKVLIFPKGNLKPGDYVNVRVLSVTSATLIGEVVN
ncbi:MAG: tRNA (N6-isopentenyl adenosine(37)-C2)-methylthiotransferase MiaB [Bacteroidota bacterium]